MEQNQESTLFGLGIDPISKSHLAEAARWSKFLAIVGFIVCGLVVLGGLFAGTYISTMMGSFGGSEEFGGAGLSASMGAVMSFLYIGMALLYFFPCLFLFKFSVHMKSALVTDDQQILNSSFQNLKRMFRFVGILTIIMLSIYLIAFLIGMVALATMG